MNIFEDNQNFLQTIKPLFSEKCNGPRKNIIIVENGVVTSDKKEAAEKLNTYFIESVRNLDIDSFVPENNTEDIHDGWFAYIKTVYLFFDLP